MTKYTIRVMKDFVSKEPAKLFVFLAVILCAIAAQASAVVGPTNAEGPAQEEMIRSNRRSCKEDEILVKFKAGVSEAKKNNLNNKYGAKKLKEFPSLRIQHLKLKKGMSVKDAIVSYASDPSVEYAQPDYVLSIQAIPNDPYFNQLWGLYNTGQSGGISGADINAPQAWDITTGSSDVVVAVIDTGVDYKHPDLAPNIWVNTGEIPGNGIDDDGDGYADDVHGIDTYNHDSDPMDDHSHGTHVSGTIGAIGNNNLGVAGINWNVKILPCELRCVCTWIFLSGRNGNDRTSARQDYRNRSGPARNACDRRRHIGCTNRRILSPDIYNIGRSFSLFLVHFGRNSSPRSLA